MHTTIKIPDKSTGCNWTIDKVDQGWAISLDILATPSSWIVTTYDAAMLLVNTLNTRAYKTLERSNPLCLKINEQSVEFTEPGLADAVANYLLSKEITSDPHIAHVTT